MFSSSDTFIFLLSFFIFYFIVSLWVKKNEKQILKSRLKDLMEYKEHLLKTESSTIKAYHRHERESLPLLRKFISAIQLEGEKEKLKLKFDKAGIRSKNAVLLYSFSKIGIVFLLGFISSIIIYKFFHLDVIYSVFAIIFIALLGSYLIDFALSMMVDARQERIIKAFPNALDLMVICADAGLSLTATIQRVAREISQLSPDLGYELALLSIELNMLVDRHKALQNFSNRLDSEYFKSIIANIAQAEHYGTPIAQTMRIVAEEFRANRLLKAEERASKLPALLSLPMMIFIFPCIYIVIMGPAILEVIKRF